MKIANYVPRKKLTDTVLELSDWFYDKSCYYKGVKSINTMSLSYIKAWSKFMWLCFNDWRKKK